MMLSPSRLRLGRLPRVRAFVLGMIVLVAPWPLRSFEREAQAAPASTKVADALSGDAKDAFNRGRVLFSKGDFAAARNDFQRAFELSQEPRVLYNVAVCLKEQGKYASAVRVLQRSAETVKNAPKEYMDRLADTIDTLLALVATVTVERFEPGMAIEVDGEPISVDETRKLLVDAGTRRIVVKKAGYAPYSFTRDFPAGERYAFPVSLVPLPGKIRVAAVGSRDGSVVLDGRDVGLAPVTLDVAPGPHEVIIRAPGYRDERRTVDVTSDEETLVNVTLERDARMARLRVVAGADDSIVIDGRAAGAASFDGALLAGEHRVVISRPDAETQTIEVALREGEMRDMRITLREKSARGLPAWLWAVRGAVVIGGATTAIYFAARPTEFEGSTPGTLSPRVVPATFRGGSGW